MRAHARGLSCAVAAVELLIGHAVWLGRTGFVDRFVETVDDLAGDRTLAWVKWRAVVRALDTGGVACSDSEAQVLRIAASLAAGVRVDLGAAVTGLDETNLGLVAAAVVRANGRGEAALGVGGVAGR
ncbi:MAG: hypothetical protein LC700_02470 [Actinobacteria bacterium]|nr:hypothetical protein [Actinomycetota bacterium]